MGVELIDIESTLILQENKNFFHIAIKLFMMKKIKNIAIFINYRTSVFTDTSIVF